MKHELETKSTKHVGNVLNLVLSDLQETRFRMEKLSKNTKTKGADKYKNKSKNCVEMNPKSMKNRFQNSTKTKLKNRHSKIKKYSKNNSKMDPKKWPDFGGNPSWRTCGGPHRFCDRKVGPQRCQSAPKARKVSQKLHKRAPLVRKRAPKVDPFRSQTKMRSKSGLFSEPGPADCAKRLQ